MSIGTRLSREFAGLLADFDLGKLEAYSQTIYGIFPDLSLGYFNSAWNRFALENGGAKTIRDWSLGANVIAAFPDCLKGYYTSLYRQALLAGRSSMNPVQHCYECSSPVKYRRYAMNLFSLQQGKGLLLVNSLIIEKLHPETLKTGDEVTESNYLDENGIYHQCSHCSRFRYLCEIDRWDWIPAWIENEKERVSHAICDFCLSHYYGDFMKPKTAVMNEAVQVASFGVARTPANDQGALSDSSSVPLYHQLSKP